MTIAIEKLVTALREVAREVMREEMRAQTGDPDAFIPHTEWPAASRRAACKLARDGKIRNAKRKGRLWFAKRRDVEAYVESLEHRKPANDTDEVAAMMATASRGRRR